MKLAPWTHRALVWGVGLTVLTLLAVEPSADAWGLGVHALLLSGCLLLLWLLFRFDDGSGHGDDR